MGDQLCRTVLTRTYLLLNSNAQGLLPSLCQLHRQDYRLGLHHRKPGMEALKDSSLLASILPNSRAFLQLALHLPASVLRQGLARLLAQALHQAYRRAFSSSPIMVEHGSCLLRTFE